MNLDDAISTPLFRFDSAESVSAWQPVDDRVMGGLSTSRLVHVAPGVARFTGHVSLALGGGFASIRSGPVAEDLAGTSAIRLVVRGDGHVYKLTVRVDDDPDGVLYQARFAAPAGETTEVVLPFDAFQATHRGRVVEARALRSQDVRRIGLMLSDRQAGPFALDVERIEAVR